MSEVKTKITIAQLLFMQSQNLLSKTRSTLFMTRKFHHFGNGSYFIIHLRHNFSLILGLILLKLKHASNGPVNPSCLQSNTKKLLPYHISTLSSEIQYTTYYNSQRQKIPQNPFPAKNLLKQTTYLLLGAKTSCYFIACVKVRNSIVSN